MEWIYYRIYDSAGNQVWSVNPHWNSTTQQSATSETVELTKGTYYFVAEKDGSRTGSYNFRLGFTSAGESFTETGSGSNNSINSADAISVNTQYKGQLAINDNVDFYRVSLSTSGRITLSATAHMEWVYYRIYDSAGNQLWSVNPHWNSTTQQCSSSERIDLKKGTYYFVVEKDGSRTGNYSVKLNFSSAGESFTETASANNDLLSKASSISVNSQYKGQLAVNDDVDFYRFTVSSSGKMVLSSTAFMEWVYYRVYDSDGNQLWSGNPHWNSTTSKINIEEEFTLSRGTYYLAVERDGSRTGNYSFKIETISAPVLSTISNVYGGVKVTWKEVKLAEMYRVYRKTGSGSWTAVGDTTSTAFTDRTAKSGTRYTYTVRCITKDRQMASGFNTTGKTITYIAPPIISTIKNYNAGVKLIWGKIPGAAKYRVFRKTGSGSWVKIGDTTSTAYTDKTAKNGTKYTYTIRCINSSGTVYTSAFNKNGKTIVFVSRPEMEYLDSFSYDEFYVEWSRNTSASGYQIQYSTSSNFSSNVKSVRVAGSANTYKDVSGLKRGTYYVRVRAYKTVNGTNYYSSWSYSYSVWV